MLSHIPSRVFVPTSREKPCLKYKAKKFRNLCRTYMYLYIYLLTPNMWLNITLQAELFLTVHTLFPCKKEIKEAVLCVNMGLFCSGDQTDDCDVNCIYSVQVWDVVLNLRGHLIDSHGSCWLPPSISSTSSTCLSRWEEASTYSSDDFGWTWHACRHACLGVPDILFNLGPVHTYSDIF